MSENTKKTGQRLREWGLSKFKSLASFARALGIEPQNLTPYLNGERSPGNKLQASLRELGCDIEWLMTGRNREGESSPIIELMNVPVYESVHAGVKRGVVADNPIDYIAIPKRKDSTLFGLKVKGRSMEPAIREGDVVIVSRSIEAKSGDLCLVNYRDGEYVLRYVHFKDKLVTLSSENAREFPPEIIPRKDIHAIHRVMMSLKQF